MNNIRITSGVLRGRTIKSPRSDSTHPMGSREKIALFNMLSGALPGSRILDAFAGSGALGIEALSRGAREAVFIERNYTVSQIIHENLRNLNLLEKSKIFTMNIRNFNSEEVFDIVIADPPYDNFDIKDIFYLTKYIKNDGVLVLSHPGIAPVIEGLKLTKTHKYAKANLSFYETKA